MPKEPEEKPEEKPEWKKKYRPNQQVIFGPLKSNKDRTLAGKARRNTIRRGRRG